MGQSEPGRGLPVRPVQAVPLVAWCGHEAASGMQLRATRREPTSSTSRGENVKPVSEFRNPLSGYAFRVFDCNGAPFKVIDSPGVYLVGSMTLHEGGVNEYLRDHSISKFTPWGDPCEPECDEMGYNELRNARGTDQELAVELSGRICYMSYERPRPGGVAAFIERIKSEGHGSVFEHPHYSFILSGVSRNMTLELNRHRPLNISQLSSRYVSANEVGFVSDPDHTPEDFAEWASACRSGVEAYNRMFARKHAKQFAKWKAANFPHLSDEEAEKLIKGQPSLARKFVKRARDSARDVLPGCLETRVYYTVNARAVRFIFEKRCHADAAFEIRRAMNGVYRALAKCDPHLYSDFTEEPLPDGTFTLTAKYPKI